MQMLQETQKTLQSGKVQVTDAAVQSRETHATGNSENVAIWKSTSDRRSRSVSRGTEDWSTMVVSSSSNTVKLYSLVTG
ncbi:hypothetical protein Tco_0844324 [Tanacetum coccineum]